MAAPETEVEESKHVSEERVLATLFVCMCVNTLTLTHTHTPSQQATVLHM